MALALNLIAGQDEPYIKGTKSMFDIGAEREKATTELKSNRLALADLERKDEQQKRITARLPELMAAAKDGKLQQDQLYDLAQANPKFVENYIAQRKYDADVAVRNRNDMKNFLTGILPYVSSATTAGQDPKLRWEQAQALAKANAVSLGNLEGLPWDSNTESALRMQINALGGLDKPDLESVPNMVGTKDEHGNMQYHALPKEEKKPVIPAVGKNGKPIERPFDLHNGKTGTERLMSDGTWIKLGESTEKDRHEKTPSSRLVETMDETGHLQFELVPDGGLPKGKPKGEGVGKIEAGRIEMINNAANDAITALSQIQQLPVASQVLPLFNSADAKKGIFTENMKKSLANRISPESAQVYRSIISGLALDAAKIKAGGMFVSQKVIDEISKGITVQDGETEGVAMFKLAETARRLYSSLSTMTRGTPEQIAVRDRLADYLKENFPDPNLIMSARLGIPYVPTPDVLHDFRAERAAKNKNTNIGNSEKDSSQTGEPKTAREWYLFNWNDAKAKGDTVRMKKLTDRYIKMGSPK